MYRTADTESSKISRISSIDPDQDYILGRIDLGHDLVLRIDIDRGVPMNFFTTSDRFGEDIGSMLEQLASVTALLSPDCAHHAWYAKILHKHRKDKDTPWLRIESLTTISAENFIMGLRRLLLPNDALAPRVFFL